MTAPRPREYYVEIGRKGGNASKRPRATYRRRAVRRIRPPEEPSGPVWDRLKDRWATVLHAAGIVGCSHSTIHQRILDGTIRAIRVKPDDLNLSDPHCGYRVLVDRHQVLAYAAVYQAWRARFEQAS